ncbi:hypothetical protein A3A14_03410 [Candidatus Daviesbacteria bacterium RIFCSPLOWO2_01_FULL_43_38]|uniref:histidine kinase n=3 Tax=Candidatus Daviesiibacteriota TaxID=1752718 RepID=A0A1F5K7Y5_9BACT|nr:MAG: Multi-sensor signal transduction histidine kinase [Candidatus Daviesbacteria bacterium GW2011_GWA1_42_6]KKS69920.1 MAG: Multi-sensor signal transduction histidine kinase [Candidatus Daviesbacteria bacterium GW2011_GWA2_42_7]OGE20627.1 MAG: hypothetical protein A2874_02035 [Candidatus Daviesbacteria bacterium RIFCSPHIGHO2_01_FULL_43_17]OGE36771.1 MAG: hypothetical protein A3E45_01455 [Candidatus Daviesbacteria bacterium RIFCSPHIGHO2_12_FULL_43_11]OGE63689.1 MAG: hypothetical protein A3A1
MGNDLEKIYKAGLKFLAPLTPEETYRTIVSEAIKLVDGDSGIIRLLVDGELEPVCHLSYPTPPLPRPRRNGLSWKTFRTRKAFVGHSEEIRAESVKSGIKSVIFIPLAYRNKSIGVLAVRSYKEDYFTQKQLKILELFGSTASLAIRKMQLYEETKKAVETRDLFLSMAAHEFRTPLTTISGYAQLLAARFPKDLVVQSKWVEEMSWEVSRLTSLVNELLEISKIRGGQFQYTWRECHITKVIERAIAELHFNYPKHKLVFESHLRDGQDLVVGDFDKLIQVVINLLDNAAKFSPSNKEIRVNLKLRSNNLVILVKDSGSGIEGKDLPRVFEGFYRGHKVANEGMGIGLFLAKNIIVQHHGLINISSKLNKGTTVEIRLPKVKL